jgi:hypothetical protein
MAASMSRPGDSRQEFSSGRCALGRGPRMAGRADRRFGGIECSPSSHATSSSGWLAPVGIPPQAATHRNARSTRVTSASSLQPTGRSKPTCLRPLRGSAKRGSGQPRRVTDARAGGVGFVALLGAVARAGVARRARDLAPRPTLAVRTAGQGADPVVPALPRHSAQQPATRGAVVVRSCGCATSSPVSRTGSRLGNRRSIGRHRRANCRCT